MFDVPQDAGSTTAQLSGLLNPENQTLRRQSVQVLRQEVSRVLMIEAGLALAFEALLRVATHTVVPAARRLASALLNRATERTGRKVE